MTLWQTLHFLLLCSLVYQASSSPWYHFEASSAESQSDLGDIKVEFYIDEIDVDSYDFDYDNMGDMEDKMINHKLLIDLTLVLSLTLLAIGMFRLASVDAARKVCLVIVILSFLNGILFLSFPFTLEEEAEWFSSYEISDSDISFFGNVYGYDYNYWYYWGPTFAWYSTTVIIPIYGLLLCVTMNSSPSPVRSRRVAGNQKRYDPMAFDGTLTQPQVLDNVSINIPRTPILPNSQTNSSGFNNLASQSPQTPPSYTPLPFHEPPSSYKPLNNDITWETKNNDVVWETKNVVKDESISSNKISFSRPDLKEKYEAFLELGLSKRGKTVYSMEGLITVSGCSEILFGTRNSDGRMVVVKRPYGYRKKEEKGKRGKVNTHASAKKQLENERHFLSKIMKHNKTNFPELLDTFNQKIGRRTDLYIVTKYFSPSLKKYVEFHGGKKGGLGFERALNLFLEIAAAVKEIHENIGYVWADLKSENILMQEDTPVLIDFGTSRPPVQGKGQVKIDSGGWSAPETIEGAPVFESDIYSLGKLFIYLLTEIPPRAKQKFDVFSAQTSHELKKRKIDKRIAGIITKCSSEKIADRYSSVSELVDDLQDFWKKSRKRCPNCNSLLGIHAKFCKACGKNAASKTKGKKKTKRVKKRKKGTKTDHCVKCDNSIDGDSKYCKHCGTEIMQPNQSQTQCLNCEEIIRINAKYCNNCGTAVR